MWLERNNREFLLGSYCCGDPKRVNLIIGGTNNGTNLRFGVGVHSRDAHRRIYVDINTIGDLTRQARPFRRDFGNGWRMQAHGGIGCEANPIRPFWNPRATVEWVIHRSVETV